MTTNTDPVPTAIKTAYALPCTLETLAMCERHTATATRVAARTGRSSDRAYAQGCHDVEVAVANRLHALRLFQEAFTA